MIQTVNHQIKPNVHLHNRRYGGIWICICLRLGRDLLNHTFKKHHPVAPCLVSDWLIIPLLPLLSPSTHTHTHTHTHMTGFQVFTPLVSPLHLFLIRLSLWAQEREGGWWGCGVCQWCYVFEQCLPPGDERMRWGRGVGVRVCVCVCVRKTKTKRGICLQRTQCTPMLHKNRVQIQQGDQFIESPQWGLDYKGSFGFMMSWWNFTSRNQTSLRKQSNTAEGPPFGLIQPQQPMYCSGTDKRGKEELQRKNRHTHTRTHTHTHTHTYTCKTRWPLAFFIEHNTVLMSVSLSPIGDRQR